MQITKVDANQLEMQKSQLIDQVNSLKESQLHNPDSLISAKAAEQISNLEKTIKKLEKQLKDNNFAVVRTKKDILTSLQDMSKNFSTLSTELDEFKKDAETVKYKSVNGSGTQIEVQARFNAFQERLNQATKSFENAEEEVENVILFRLRNTKLESATKGESNKKLLEDFTKIWSEVATNSHRIQADAKYVNNRIADLPKMEDLLANMQEEAKRIATYVNLEEILNSYWSISGKCFIVKEEKRNEFNDFVETSKKTYNTLFETLLELGKSIEETQKNILAIDKKSEYAEKLAYSNNAQKEINKKNFIEISNLGNADNKFLSDKYLNTCIALFKANEALNYEMSYMHAVAKDFSKPMPSRLTSLSITLDPDKKVDAKLIKIEVPVVVSKLEEEIVEDAVKTSDGEIAIENSNIKVEDVLLNG